MEKNSYLYQPEIDIEDYGNTSEYTIYNFLKEKVGSSLLKSTSVIAFGRRLSNIPELKKNVNKYSSVYLVKQKNP